MTYEYKIPNIPPSLNKYAGRKNVWMYREDKQMWKNLVSLSCRPKPEHPIDKAVVTLTYYFSNHRRHDPDNYAGKMVLDGLTDAGIIADDSFEHIELRLRGSYDKHTPRTEITIQEVESLE